MIALLVFYSPPVFVSTAQRQLVANQNLTRSLTLLVHHHVQSSPLDRLTSPLPFR